MTNVTRFQYNCYRILLFTALLLCGFLYSSILTQAQNSPVSMDEETAHIYQILKTECGRIADGEKSSVIIRKVSEFFDKDSYTYKELGIDTNNLSINTANDKVKELLRTRIKQQLEEALDRMKIDCPYELYWFDRESNVQINFSYVRDSRAIYFEKEDTVIITMNVIREYQKNGISIQIHPNVIARAKAAKRNALSIVNKYASLSTQDKILAYAREIHNRTSYNQEAVTDTYLSKYGYGDAYQLVSVLDNDPSTTTVCEGYAKAFQYLCDLSDFQDASSYIVTGSINCNNANGSHMWNLIRMHGQSTLVDITNTDPVSGDLILAGGVDLGGQYLLLNKENQKVFYTYDEDSLRLYSPGLLTLAHTHIPADPVIENKIEASCTTPASYDTVIYCKYCKEELSRQSYQGTKGEHVFQNTTFPRTCESDGYKLHKCTRCGYTYTNSVIPSYGSHSWNSGTKNADSTISYSCLRCGKTKKEGSPLPTPVVATNKTSPLKNKVLKIQIKSKLTVKAGKSLTLKAVVSTSTGKPIKVKWSVNYKKYAKINSKGKLTALKAGKGRKIVVTATAADGSGKKASVTIRIKK